MSAESREFLENELEKLSRLAWEMPPADLWRERLYFGRVLDRLDDVDDGERRVLSAKIEALERCIDDEQASTPAVEAFRGKLAGMPRLIESHFRAGLRAARIFRESLGEDAR